MIDFLELKKVLNIKFIPIEIKKKMFLINN